MRYLFLCLIGTLFSHACLFSQTPYLSPIGATEIELMASIDREDGRAYFRQPSSGVWLIERENLTATYNIHNGKVTYVMLDQYFFSQEKALESLHTYEAFLHSRGVSLEVPSPRFQPNLQRGKGNHLSCRLIYMEQEDGRFRINISLSYKVS